MDKIESESRIEYQNEVIKRLSGTVCQLHEELGESQRLKKADLLIGFWIGLLSGLLAASLF